MRLAPDGMSEIIMTLEEGAAFNVLGIEGDWIRIEVNGQTGYIYKTDVPGVVPETEATAEGTDMKVTIFSSRRSVMKPGETVQLTSVLEGFEHCEEIAYQWECDKGSGFEAVSGATGATYAFAATRESLSWNWQLAVYFR